uniref:Phospholipase/carboxylesterase/thioesterase domain-containing protein n=1 Tax=Odontella aurita TaxID=265563 RepID=A0A7S4JC06_9STRA|mmetsp:Transcript_43404/g.132055  ORF Transcript_43404/g.132055 Transcript_43404/m.132055 type:complete len:392 (+) Transcript_43404:82-1257(+)
MMEESESVEGAETCRLEVLQTFPSGEKRWTDAGPIDLAKSTSEASAVGKAAKGGAATPTASVSPPLGCALKKPGKKYLPRRAKLLLAPCAKTKSDRRRRYLYRHSPGGIDTNLLVLLHGAGDSHVPFDGLAKKMKIPQAAALSVSASSCGSGGSSGGFVTLPFGLGYTWFEEMDYEKTGKTLEDEHPRRVGSLGRAVDRLVEALASLMHSSSDNDKCRGSNVEMRGTKSKIDDSGWIPERIFLLGYGAGACLAMETCARLAADSQQPLGGAVCVSGGSICDSALSRSSSHKSFAERATPILMMAGSRDRAFPPATADRLTDMYNQLARGASESSVNGGEELPPAQVFVKEGKEGGMIQSEEETKALMTFFAEMMTRRMPCMEAWTKVKATT